jgi:hypothetical protein
VQNAFAILYVASGPRYIEEAVRSARSCRARMPQHKIVLLTPDDASNPIFDEIIRFGSDIGDPFLLKIAGIAAADLDRFVFLDTDTYLLDDISELAALLERFDIAAAHAPIRLQSNIWPETREFLEEIPVCFPEFNTGVIGMRNSPQLRAMLNDWKAGYEAHMRSARPPRTQDQASFRSAIYRSNLRIATLPPEYNCRLLYPASVCGTVKLLHAHGDDALLDQIGQVINRRRGFRIVAREEFLTNSVVIRDQNSGASRLPKGQG